MEQMMALRAHIRGGPEGLLYEAAPRPALEPGDALVEVAAAGITFAELDWDETWTRQGRDRTPIIPSHELAGVVVEAEEDAAHLAVGAPVFGIVPFGRDGAAAQFVAVPARFLVRRPPEISDVTAAAAPLTALTAWQALTVHSHCTAGTTVLVQGAAGGVGGMVTQMAAALGAHVTGTARGEDLSYVKKLGAETVIDDETEAFDDHSERYDIVIDTVGGRTLDRSYAVVRRGGQLVTLQAPPSRQEADRYGITATFFVVEPDREQLIDVAALIVAGGLDITIAETYPLADGRNAYLSGRRIGRPSGKTVLVVR